MSEKHGGLMLPEKILEQLEISEEARIADFGCGGGYFSIPLAKTARQGKVFALDIIKDNLEAVKSKAELDGIGNIVTRHCNLEEDKGSKIKSISIDLVMMRNILFQSQRKEAIIKEAHRVLSPDGQLIIIEWQAGSVLAPKQGWLMSEEQARQLAESFSLVFVKELVLDEHHFGLVYKK